jgi:hypothetical protein
VTLGGLRTFWRSTCENSSGLRRSVGISIKSDQQVNRQGFPSDFVEWVERFFWHWFTGGIRASTSEVEFVRIWRAMIAYALEHPAWDPSGTVSYELDGLVVELMCFDIRWKAVV